MSARFDYLDPSLDTDRCDALSIDPDEERVDEQRELDDIAEAAAAKAREYPQWKKGAA